MRQAEATTFAQRLLPQPCTPSSKMPRGGSRPNSRARAEKPPRRRLSHRFRFFSPPISSGETSAAIDSRQPVVPSRLRLASTIRGRSEPSSTLSSWMAPDDHAGGLLGGQPAQASARAFPARAWSASIRPAGGCAAAPPETSCGRSPSSSSSSGQPTSKGTVSRRTSGGSGDGVDQDQRPQPRVGREIQIADASAPPAGPCSAGRGP